MADRNVIIRDEGGAGTAGLVLVAVLILAALVAMFVWQPWHTYGAGRNTTTIQVNPGPPSGTTGGSNTGSSNTGSSSTSGSTNGASQSSGSGTTSGAPSH